MLEKLLTVTILVKCLKLMKPVSVLPKHFFDDTILMVNKLYIFYRFRVFSEVGYVEEDGNRLLNYTYALLTQKVCVKGIVLFSIWWNVKKNITDSYLPLLLVFYDLLEWQHHLKNHLYLMRMLIPYF